MDFTSDFFKSSTTLRNFGIEDTLNFLIDNYVEVISRYRLISKQNNDLLLKKKEAKENLDKLREEKQQIRLSKREVSHAEKVEMASKENLYKKIIKSTEHAKDEKGEVVEYDHITRFITKNRYLFKGIDNVDKRARKGLGKIAEKGGSLAIWPLKRSLFEALVNVDDPNVEEMLEGAIDYVGGIPDELKEIFK
jgi:hypothetical protein